MGVSGSGKSTVGSALASRLGLGFVDADDLHSEHNIAKMAAGIPLTDEDRFGWLHEVGAVLARPREGRGLVVACSALRRRYRDIIREASPGTVFVHLSGSPELLHARLGKRTGHFMPEGLLGSQLSTLEPLASRERGITVDIDRDVASIVDDIVERLEAL